MTEHRANDDPGAIRLKWVDALVALATVGLLIVAVLGLGELTADFEWDTSTRTAFSAGVTLVGHLIGVVFLIWYLRKRQVGTGLTPLRKDAWHLLWETPLIIIAAAVVSALVAEFVLDIPLPERSTPDEMEMSPVVHIVRFATAGLLVPLFEELVFRRILMRYFDRLMPAFFSVVLSAVVFAAVHFSPTAVVGTLISGIGLALVARRHNSLWASVIVHACNNSFAYLLLLVTILG